VKIRAVIAAVVCWMTAGCASQASQRDLERRVAALEQNERLKDAAVGSLDFQSKCADRAEKVFNAGTYDRDGQAEYKNHFSPLLGKCFVLISYTYVDKHGVVRTSKTLSDAFESTVFGSYSSSYQSKIEVMPAEPDQCSVTLPSGEEKSCRSSMDFEALARAYMQ